MGCGYGFAKFMMTSTLNIFFANGVEIVNKENIPKDGGVILVGNHMNQFVDSMVMLKAAGRRRPGFIVAEKSMHRRVIGDFARLLNAVPVIRPQDRAAVGAGTIVSVDLDGLKLTASDSEFTKAATVGGVIAIKNVGNFPIKEIVSDTELVIKAPGSDSPPNMSEFESGAGYKILPKISQDEVFEKVYKRLLDNGSIGIFPEGGSHDNTDLLPLKAGVTLMALGAASRGAKVRICAVGINYFNAHVFRSNAFVDISEPIEIDPELLKQFNEGGKREACGKLLDQIRDSLRSVTMHAEDYDTLKAVRTARRMYQNNVKLTSTEFIKLNNRFMAGNDLWTEKGDQEYKVLLQDIKTYLRFCWSQGLTDKQVRDLPPLGRATTIIRAWWEILVTLFVCLVALPIALPGIILNLPIWLRVNKIVKKEMVKALAGSTVKIAARDVAASQKVMVGATTTTFLLFFYTITGCLLTFFLYKPDVTSDEWYSFLAENAFWIAPVAFFFLFPIYTFYFVVKVGESVSNRIKLLKVNLKCAASICGSSKKNPAEALRQDRKRLVIRVQEFVESQVEELPGWSSDRVISREKMIKHRSAHTNKLFEAQDLTPQLSQSASEVSIAVSSEVESFSK